MKQLLLLFFLIFSLYGFSQNVERVKVQGKITAPSGAEVEGINVYNISAQKGTVTDTTGLFSLEMAENDRVLITAIQYNSFTLIIDKSVIDAKKMSMYLNPAINQLDEVVVRQYDLSGNLVVDVNKIKTIDLPEWDIAYEDMEYGYNFRDDTQTSIRGNGAEEAFHNGQQQYTGVNFLAIAGILLNAIIPKKEKEAPRAAVPKDLIPKTLHKRFTQDHIAATFDVPLKKVNDFIFFVQENGMDKKLLKPENEMQLIDFMYKQAKIYKTRSENY